MGDFEKFLGMDFKNGLLFFAAAIILFVFIIQKWDFIVSRFGIKTKRIIEEETQNQDIKDLKSHAERTDQSMDSIVKGLEQLEQSVQSLSTQVQTMQDKSDANEAARLKDRIAQSYRYYHEKKEWTSMEREALVSLITSYSKYSDNSFVHSIVEKELHTWRVIDE